MEQGRPSLTAVGAAVMRALHQTLDGDPKILDDPIAPRLIDQQDDFYKSRVELLERLPPGVGLRFRSGFVMRSRYAEDCLADSFADGVRQYVLLGAGLDTFAYRQPSWARSFRIFEVDHAATQAWKRDYLAAANIALPDNLSLVSIDFEKVSLAEGLSAAGLDFSAPAFFSLLGVSQYLSEEALDLTLKFVLSLPVSSELVFSFVLQDQAAPPDEAALMKIIVTQAAAIGEPWLSRFIPEELAAKLATMGFSRVVHLSPEEANRRYFTNRSDGLNAAFAEQMMRAKV
jgi:methyltransferase (TIGR00027 family)